MAKQIEIFSPYDPIIKDMVEFLKRGKGNHQHYQIEVCNLNDPRDERIISDLLYHSCFIEGQIGRNPHINYRYFKHHGTREQSAKAEKELEEFYELREKIAGGLEKEFESMKNKPKKLRKEFVFLGVRHFVEIRANQAA